MLKLPALLSLLIAFALVLAEAPPVIGDTIDAAAEQAKLTIADIGAQAPLETREASDREAGPVADKGLPLLKDVFLVLDNSGSMKQNDPGFLVSKAVRKFISLQDENTRVGIVIFDQSVRLPVPLTEASLANRETILGSLSVIDYRGLLTDSPSGIERAIYRLKNNGREEAEKSIIFMTDGIVDTGDPEKDAEKSKWLREDLALDAADNGIRIFAIAFTEQADFQLIQSVAQKTDGEYFRALDAKDLRGVFERIDSIINEPTQMPELEPVSELEPVAQTPPPPPIVQPAPVIIKVPSRTIDEGERIREMAMIAAAIALILALFAALFLIVRRSNGLRSDLNEATQEAYLNDLSGKTDKPTHKLGSKPTMLGRVAGQDRERLDYIVVNESTTGRRHALIEYKDYSFWIIDQGSINGTFVNNEPVKAKMRLKHGDRIRLHRCEFEFVMPEMENGDMTTVSSTVFAGQSVSRSEEATVIRNHGEAELSASDKQKVKSSYMNVDAPSASDPADGDLFNLYGPDSDKTEAYKRNGQGESEEPEFALDDSLCSEDTTTMLGSEDRAASEDTTTMLGDEGLESRATPRKDDP